MRIPPETRAGQKFKLAGEGLPDANSGKRGDHIVTVRIELPAGLNEKEKELYRELAHIRKFNPREHMIFEK
jgi:DnaJ-class molecular chaperone